MKTKHSTQFWIVFALWVFATLFMSFVEFIAIYEFNSEKLAFLVYTFLASSASGILLVLFNSLYLFKDKLYFRKLAILFLVGYLIAQLTMIGYCVYLHVMDIKSLFGAIVIRVIFVLFQLAISLYILRKRK